MRTLRNPLVWSVVGMLGMSGGLPAIAAAQTASSELNRYIQGECGASKRSPANVLVTPRIVELHPLRGTVAQNVWARWTLYIYEKSLRQVIDPSALIVYTRVKSSNWWVGIATAGDNAPTTWTERIYNPITRQYRIGNRLAAMNPDWAMRHYVRNVPTWLFAKVEYTWTNRAGAAIYTKTAYATNGNAVGRCFIE